MQCKLLHVFSAKLCLATRVLNPFAQIRADTGRASLAADALLFSQYLQIFFSRLACLLIKIRGKISTPALFLDSQVRANVHVIYYADAKDPFVNFYCSFFNNKFLYDYTFSTKVKIPKPKQ